MYKLGQKISFIDRDGSYHRSIIIATNNEDAFDSICFIRNKDAGFELRLALIDNFRTWKYEFDESLIRQNIGKHACWIQKHKMSEYSIRAICEKCYGDCRE